MTTLRPLASPARALYRTLILPTLRPSTASQAPSKTAFPTRPARRHINRSAGASSTFAAPRTPFNDPTRPLDEKIQSRMVHHVDQSETVTAPQMLSYLLTQITRSQEHIQQVGSHSETGLPVVKVRTKRWLRENEQVKEAQKKVQTKNQTSGKELELTWGIERNNDLEHRLKKMEGWLAEGKNVEILLGQKRGGRKASQEESEELVEILRQRALDVVGAHQAEQMVGTVGGQAVLKFLGKEAEKTGVSTAAAMRKERQEKMKKKEEEKAKKREEAEEKRKRAETREKERMERLRERATAGG